MRFGHSELRKWDSIRRKHSIFEKRFAINTTTTSMMLLTEELGEFSQAWLKFQQVPKDKDIRFAKMRDAVGDMAVALCGMMNRFGLTFYHIFGGGPYHSQFDDVRTCPRIIIAGREVHLDEVRDRSVLTHTVVNGQLSYAILDCATVASGSHKAYTTQVIKPLLHRYAISLLEVSWLFFEEPPIDIITQVAEEVFNKDFDTKYGANNN